MEATEEVGGLLGKIRPPRLEDAGLENCALPPESITEAFLKAADAVGSILSASSDDEAEGHCVNDPFPTFDDSSDTLLGISDGVDDVLGGCSTEKGGVPEMAGDEVAVQDAEKKVDEVVVGGPTVPESGEAACVDGLQGLEIGEKSRRGIKGKKLKDVDAADNIDDGNREKDGERPILTEGQMEELTKGKVNKEIAREKRE